MRSLALLLGTLLLAAPSAAHADSRADLSLPSSTLPGCVNHWGLFGTGSGIAEPTCEGKVALAEWNMLAAAVGAARDTLADTANAPGKTTPLAVIGALDACAAAADAMARLDRPAPVASQDAALVASMRTGLAPSRQPVPATIGDGFRALAARLAKPGLLPEERNALYRLAAVFAARESVLAAARGAEVERRTDDAVRAAHFAALTAAENAEAGLPQPDAGAAITAAAGPGRPALAERQTAQLAYSLAAHPDQGKYRARTRRALAAIPTTLLGILGLAVILVVVGFRRLADRLGLWDALGFSLLLLVVLPASWLPVALLHAATGRPAGGLSLLLWLVLSLVLFGFGPRLLPGRWHRVWVILFAPAPPTTHGSAAARSRSRPLTARTTPAGPSNPAPTPPAAAGT